MPEPFSLHALTLRCLRVCMLVAAFRSRTPSFCWFLLHLYLVNTYFASLVLPRFTYSYLPTLFYLPRLLVLHATLPAGGRHKGQARHAAYSPAILTYSWLQVAARATEGIQDMGR